MITITVTGDDAQAIIAELLELSAGFNVKKTAKSVEPTPPPAPTPAPTPALVVEEPSPQPEAVESAPVESPEPTLEAGSASDESGSATTANRSIPTYGELTVELLKLAAKIGRPGVQEILSRFGAKKKASEIDENRWPELMDVIAAELKA